MTDPVVDGSIFAIDMGAMLTRSNAQHEHAASRGMDIHNGANWSLYANLLRMQRFENLLN